MKAQNKTHFMVMYFVIAISIRSIITSRCIYVKTIQTLNLSYKTVQFVQEYVAIRLSAKNSPNCNAEQLQYLMCSCDSADNTDMGIIRLSRICEFIKSSNSVFGAKRGLLSNSCW